MRASTYRWSFYNNYTVDPLYPWVLYPWIQTTEESSIFDTWEFDYALFCYFIEGTSASMDFGIYEI